MENWKLFEEKSKNYLDELLLGNGYTCRVSGGSNANSSDIEVFKGDVKVTVLECKLLPCQSGQFVVCDNGILFIFSSKNKTYPNMMTDNLIEYLNQNYKKFKQVAQGAIPLEGVESVAEAWIEQYYTVDKNVDFICFSNSLEEVHFVEICDFSKVFKMFSNLRKKRSGSSHLSKTKESEIKCMILDRYKIEDFRWIGKKAIVELGVTFNSKTDKMRYFEGEDKTYFLGDYEGGKFVIKQVSKTNNPNIIFSLNLKQNYEHFCVSNEKLKALLNEKYKRLS